MGVRVLVGVVVIGHLKGAWRGKRKAVVFVFGVVVVVGGGR